jgi:hypothetical protein
VEEGSAITLKGIFGGVWVGDETPGMVGAGGCHQCVPDRVLTEELLDEAVEHVPEEAHLWTAGDRAEMVEVHGKFCIYGGDNVWVIEILEDVGKDDGAICVPSGPGVGSCETVEDLLRVELEGWSLERVVTIDD